MDRVSEEVKSTFENRINKIKTKEETKREVYITMLYTVSVILFILVLLATIASYQNYKIVKNNIKGQTPVVELKS